MRRALLRSIAAGAIAALAVVILADPAGVRAQVLDKSWKPAGPVPRMPDGKPDLSGAWWQGEDLGVKTLGLGSPQRGAPPPRPEGSTCASLYQPWAAAKAKTLSEKDDPALRCIPSIDGAQMSNVFQIMQSPTFVALLQETYHGFRLIPTAADRKHRDDVAPALWGDSVGHWEGDTLVVDVTNFSDQNWILAQGNVSFHSDALHITERYTRTAANALEVEKTYDDPKVLIRPFVQRKRVYALAPFDQIMEVMCVNTETAALMEAAAKENYGRK